MQYIKESIREDDYIYLSAPGQEEDLKQAIERVACGLHRAMTQRNIDTIVGYNALIVLLATYSARMSQGDRVAVDEICDSAAKLVKRYAIDSYSEIYNWNKP